MKLNEYIKRYNLKEHQSGLNREGFIEDLTNDFNIMVEFHRKTSWNHNKFRLCVNDIKRKFDSIAAKSGHPHVNEKLWKYFYATFIGPLKDQMFGKSIQNKDKRDQNKQNPHFDFFEPMALLEHLIFGTLFRDV